MDRFVHNVERIAPPSIVPPQEPEGERKDDLTAWVELELARLVAGTRPDRE